MYTHIVEGINFLFSIVLIILCSYSLKNFVLQNECAKKPKSAKNRKKNQTDDNRIAGIVNKIRFSASKVLGFFYQKIIKIDDSPYSPDTRIANTIAKIFFISEFSSFLISYILWVIYVKSLNIDNSLKKMKLIAIIVGYFIVGCLIVFAIQKLLKFTFLGVKNFAKVTKHIGKPWEYICFIVILSYISEFVITRVSWWEYIVKWIRIGLMGLVMCSLMVMIYDLVIEAIRGEFNYDYKIFIKFIICVIILQISCLSIIMLDGVMLSKYKKKQGPTVEQVSEGSTVEQVSEESTGNQVSNESTDKQISEEQRIFVFHYPEDISLLLNNTPTADDNNKNKDLYTSLQKNKTELICMSLYYVTMTYTSVGYGDIYPISNLARIFSIGVSAIGYIMSAVFFGVLLSGITAANAKYRASSTDWLIRRRLQRDICKRKITDKKKNHVHGHDKNMHVKNNGNLANEDDLGKITLFFSKYWRLGLKILVGNVTNEDDFGKMTLFFLNCWRLGQKKRIEK